ncbi:MAG: hypothetical protein P4L43_02710 [Syntrophobacteraceae bacterium]|nr:hypothetical protein [Syntrophobacteraceae bacterium]
MRTALSALLLIAFLCAVSASGAAKSPLDLQQTDAALGALEPIIGDFPPNVHSDVEKKAVERRYRKLERTLDALVAKNPRDAGLLLRRGELHCMGHNLDVPGAWKKAEADLKEVIALEPRNERAILELGTLYVNTNPIYAPKAEALFLQALKIRGNGPPLEVAHRGLMFACYYRGKMKEALAEAELLVRLQPSNTSYRKLVTVHRRVKLCLRSEKEPAPARRKRKHEEA